MRLSARAIRMSTLHREGSAHARSGRPLFTVGGQRSPSRDQDVHSSPWGVSARARAIRTSTLHRGGSALALARSGRPLFTVGGQRSRDQDVHSSPWGVSACATPTAMPTPTYEKDPARDKSRAPRSVVDEFQLLPVARRGQRSRDQDVHSSPWGVSARARAIRTSTLHRGGSALARPRPRCPRRRTRRMRHGTSPAPHVRSSMSFSSSQ